MKTKYKFKLKHNTDPETSKIDVIVNYKGINDITYTGFTKIEGLKYNDVKIHDNGNGLELVLTETNSGLSLQYHEVEQLFAILVVYIKENGYNDILMGVK